MIDLAYPFTGRWSVRNSPADRVPSHGTALFASSYAIDFVPVTADGGTAPVTLGSILVPEPAERFPGFGRPVLAPLDGTVVAVRDGVPDHAARRGLPSVAYALTQGRRAAAGWVGLAGNHVFVQAGDEVGVTAGREDGALAPPASVAVRAVVALCHLRRGSVAVEVGQRVGAGDTVGECGNSGNSTEPHLHVQAFDSVDVAAANAVRLMFAGAVPANGEVIDA